MKNIKIRSKLLIVFLLIGILSVTPIILISMTTFLESTKDQAYNFGDKSAYYNAQIIQNWLDDKANLLKNIRQQLENNEKLDKSEIEEILYNHSETNNDFISIFLGTEDNLMIDAYGWTPDKNYIIKERPWYQKAMDSNNTVVTSVYKDYNLGTYVTAIALPIKVGQRNGVLAANIQVDYIVNKIDEIYFGSSGFAVLLDENNLLITGPNDINNNKIFSNLYDRFLEEDILFSKDIDKEVEIENDKYFTVYSNIEKYGWNLFLIAPVDDFLKENYRMENLLYTIALLTLFILILLGIMFSRTISKPIEKLIEQVSFIAKGDLDHKVEIVTKDEIGQLSKEIEKMRNNLKKIFDNVKYESKILSLNTKLLSEHLDETYRGTYRFMSMLSHDIKTPITLIKGYVQGLKMGVLDERKEDEYLDKILYRSNQLEMITSDILDCTYEMNNIKLNKKILDLRDYVNMVCFNSENHIVNTNREFKKNIKISDYGCYVEIDIIKTQRVLNNIISNAVKFSEKSSRIELIIEQDKNKIITIIKDEGIGLKNVDKNKTFNMFYKSEGEEKGYGLGLYISKAIIEAHNGEIFLSHNKDKGANCGFVLNCHKKS